MAAENTDAQQIGTHRMIYGPNVLHYYIERPDRIFYHTEQIIRSMTAFIGDRFILSRQRREIQDSGLLDIHFMTTRQPNGWSRETVVFRTGDPSPYPVEEKTPAPIQPRQEEDATIRRIVIQPYEPVKESEEDEDPPFRIRTGTSQPRTYWDEIHDSIEEFDDSFDDPLDDPLEEVEDIEEHDMEDEEEDDNLQ